jgi:hypothetical protein
MGDAVRGRDFRLSTAARNSTSINNECTQLIPLRRVLFDNPIIGQVVKKFSFIMEPEDLLSRS